MDYDTLLAEYNTLKKENERLRADNAILRENLQQNGVFIDNKISAAEVDPTQTCHAPVNHNSSASQKIDLFMSLFKGRTDVYARRWVNDKKGTAGYSPACAYEWHKNGVCQKPKVKCISCPNKNFLPFNQGVVKAHLSGKTIAGVYPLLNDDTCYFLAIDFDKGNWQENITTFREACKDWGINCLVERSRSGNGAHVWFFFQTAISAALARKFGSALLTYAMSKDCQVGLNSYDRLFPSQDTLPAGGLGNLIALPLQKEARDKGNSVFVDENFTPYSDQWAYLSAIEKLTAEQVERYVKEIAGNNELGTLLQDSAGKEDDKPWEINRGKYKVSPAGMPSQITISRANMLYIPKRGLPPEALNQIAWLAAFKNPEFHKRQAMRLPIHNYPRIIHLEESSENYLAIPRGCGEGLLQFFKECHVKAVFQDETNPGKTLNVDFTGELTEQQIEAGETLLKYDYGVLNAPPGFGKTVLAAWLIGNRKVNTLILVHLKQLHDQWKERLNQFLHIEEVLPDDDQPKKGRKKKRSLIGDISGGKDRRSGLIDVALIQSLYGKNKEDEVNPCLKDYGMVIVDECHHISAFSFEKVIKAAHARYVYGLTATPTRQDGHHPIIFMHCGPIRYKVDPRSQSAERPFEHTVLPRFTSFRMPPRGDAEKWHIQQIYTAVTESDMRNQLIIDDVAAAAAEGRNSIVLVHRTAHVDKLIEMLEEEGITAIKLTGGLKDKERRAVRAQLAENAGDRPPVIVATGKYIGEGFDYAPLDTLFLASPVAWHGTVQQYIGRLHRLYPWKQEVRVIDYVDIHEYVLEKMYYKRIKAYTGAGYAIKAPNQDGREVEVLYDQGSYWETYCRDIFAAREQILVASPFVAKRQLEKMLSILKPVMAKEVKVTVLTRPAADYKEAEMDKARRNLDLMQDAGVNIVHHAEMYQRFTVIDYSIVWYGSINFLGYSNSDANVMRINNRDLAVEIALKLTSAAEGSSDQS